MTSIKVLGNRDESLKNVKFGANLGNFSVSEAVQFSNDRASSEYQVLKGLKKDDVIELIYEEDIHRWVTVEELEREFKYQLSRGEEADVMEIPARLPTGETSRGATTWALKALRVLKFDPVKLAAGKFAEFWDSRIMPKPGLFRFDKGFDNPSADIKQLKKEKAPILLFIHGTFSSAAGGFGGFHPEVWKALQQEYGERIFGYDHRTLSLSPVENAVDLVKRLPAGAKLHLVTHSRGGLIGELLCRGGRKDRKTPFDADDLSLVADNPAVVKALTDLSDLLAAKKITVERFVRVACPARGTALAGKKLDRWLEVIINVIGKLLPPGAAETYGVITDLLLDFKKQAADPKAMPGLASMTPESNFIKLINRADVQLEADLSVIAGDIERNDIIGRLALFFTDLYYSDENDLVVQTPAMYGGPTRKEGRYFFYKGPGVHHSSYFSNKRTAEVIKDALITDPLNKLGAKGFRPLEEAYVSAVPELQLDTRSFQKRSNLSQPVVYILPGIMGTHLAEGGERIWLNVLELAQGRVANLRIANRNVQPQALVRLAYANLVDYLSATHEVIPFPYDWRLSIMNEASRFADVLEAKLEETDQPIRILAHSMGGLVTRAMIAQRPELWERVSKRNGSRFLMLGTPNRGSYQIPRLILGQEKTFRMLAMLDIKNSVRQLLDVIVRFPGVLQLLPMDANGALDFLDPATWDKLPNPGGKWVKPQAEDLEKARKFQEFLEKGKENIGDWNSLIYVAGYGRGAPVGAELAGKDEVAFVGTNQGDGTVPWETGILPEFGKDRTYYMDVPHGDLANHRESFAAIYDLLNDGATMRLSKTPPRYDRGQEDRYPLRDEGVEIYPSQLDLETAVLGASPIQHQAPAVKQVKVSVVHGNLSFCSNPVAVGHYEGDGLFSAEKSLDYHLNGRLSDRLRLGRYPGPEGTAEVVLNEPGGKPGGAIVVGLGKAGELSPHKLTLSFANALREFGIKAAENGLAGEDGGLTISTLLIGTGGNGLSVMNSVDAILSAVLHANRSFSQVVLPGQDATGSRYNIRITEVQFIELFKDQAILAVKALRSLPENPTFAINEKLQKTQGGWKRTAYEEPAGWWKRIYIRAEEQEDGSLIFSVPTDRARSEDSRLAVQRPSLDRLIAQAVRTPNWDKDLASALFELTIPNRIKGSFKDMQSALFVVDREAARYPWELMYDRHTGEDRPLVVQMGMIRQFSTFNFQERVVDVRNKRVMVIGNPANAPAGFSDLPGAEQEAQQVASKLEEHDFDVRQAIHADPEQIMSQLFSQDYRVLHLAGHGVYRYTYKRSEDARPEEYTGMVLGDGIFLTANEIRQKMNIPELVFINCCHLGKFSSPEEDRDPKYAFNDFAASLSEELINMGVKAVVAAGWAVDDAAALTFAEVFYDRLLIGDAFGDAVQAARNETYQMHKDRTNTWGAYQCYGDPTYHLVIKTGDGGDRSNRFVDIDEAIIKINQIYELAKTTSAQGIGRIRDEIRSVLKDIQENDGEWLKDAVLLNALGEAFGEAFLFEEAAKYYRLAAESGEAGAPIKALEQLANCNIRLAVREYENNPAKYAASKAVIEKQIRDLNQLMVTVGETTERLSMVGSGYKRLALISAEKSQKACDSALKKMESAYQKAWKKGKDAYPLKNYLVAAIVQMLRSGVQPKDRLPELRGLIDTVQDQARQNKLNAPDDFWANVGVTEAKFVDHLHRYSGGRSKSFTEELSRELASEYRAAWKQYGSARELNSILEHYTFLAAVLKPNTKNAALCRELEKITAALKSMVEEGQ